jgi:hypothetical protein
LRSLVTYYGVGLSRQLHRVAPRERSGANQ